MTDFEFWPIDFDIELLKRGNPLIAAHVVLNRLAHNDLGYRAQIMERLAPDRFRTDFLCFLADNMMEMIKHQGRVNAKEIRRRIHSFGGSPEFQESCFLIYDHMLAFELTPEQVVRAIQILESLPKRAP